MGEDNQSVIIRAALPTDLNFIRRTWLSGLRITPNGLPDDFWWPAHRAYIEAQLATSNNKINIVAAGDNPHEILGYCIASEKVLEWIHVRKGLRGNGLAGVLLRSLGFNQQQKPLTRWRTNSSRALQLLYRPMELRK